MTDEQASDWAYKIICFLGISTSNSDINVVSLHKTVKALYEQGRADEREAIAKMFEAKIWAYEKREIVAAIRARGEA